MRIHHLLQIPKKTFSSVWILITIFGLLSGFVPDISSAKERAPLPRALQQVLADASQEIKDGKLEAAIDRMSQFRKSHTDLRHPLLSFMLANAYLQTDNAKAALPLYREASELDPEDDRIWQNLAIAAYQTGKPAEAAIAMQKAFVAGGETNLTLLYHCGLFHLMAEAPKPAWTALSDLMIRVRKEKTEPDRTWVRAYIRTAMETERLETAVQETIRFLERHPEDSEFWDLRFRLHMQRKQYRKAIAALEIHMGLVSPKPEDYTRLAELYAAVRIPARAADAYAMARKTGKKDPALYLKEAKMRNAAHQTEKALALVETGLRAGAPQEIRKVALSIHMEEKDYEKALAAGSAYRKETGDNDGRLLLTLGYCAFKSGDTETAKSLLRQVRKTRTCRRCQREARQLLAHLKRIS